MRRYGVFCAIASGILFVMMGLFLGEQNAYAGVNDYSFNIRATVWYSVSNCAVDGEMIVCDFRIDPDEAVEIVDPTVGNPPAQTLRIDIVPKGDYGIDAIRNKYLGYWDDSMNETQLIDAQHLLYQLKAWKRDLEKEEDRGDITTIKYTGKFCFEVDVHWRENDYVDVTHGVSVYCADFSASERRPSSFEGKTDAGAVTTGWTSEDSSKKGVIRNCSPINGCEVEFKHALRRTAGYGSANYVIRRQSNYSELGVTTKKLKEDREYFNSGNEAQEYSEIVKLMPGQIVCESMYFKVNSDNKYSETAVCVYAIGDAQGAGAVLDMKVKNETVSQYNQYMDIVYAKPGDKLKYKATYNPRLQYAAKLVPEAIKINNGNKIENNMNLSLYKIFNNKNGNMQNWNNAFLVISEGFSIGFSKNYKYEVGDKDKKEEINEYTVTKNNVGSILKEKARTNANSETSTTPSGVSFTMEDGTLVGNVNTGSLSDEAEVVVPYNFINEAEVDLTDDILYAGETANISYIIYTKPKYNSKIGGTPYATLVKKPKWKVEVCYGDDYGTCYESGENSGEYLHKVEDIYSVATKKDDSTKISVNVPDVPAGTKVRVRAAVYPATSGGGDNWQDPEGDHRWTYSMPKYLTVAKRPSFQVWGGNVYSAGNINLSKTLSKKNNLSGYGNGIFVFGSWAEMGLISKGVVKGFASGAGLGYSSLSLAANPGGGNNNNFCKISTLSFANRWCNSNNGLGSANYTGDLNDAYTGKVDAIKSELIARFSGDDVVNTVDEISLTYDDESKKIERDVYYYHHGSGDLSIVQSEIGKGVTKVVNADGNIYINGDIKYQDDGYQLAVDIQKVILYAEGNIIINCGVQRIDAVLIANGDINTCNSGDINARQNSNQLKINGTVISNTLTLNRTYGAATGNNSVVPAEIVNYDNSLYLWGNRKFDMSETGKIKTAYQKELSPRY